MLHIVFISNDYMWLSICGAVQHQSNGIRMAAVFITRN
jgi:hypothetical protein